MTKVLHIIENFNGQAIEKWLYQMVRYLSDDGSKFNWTFYSILGQAGKYDDAILELGAKIIYSPHPIRQWLAFLRALRKSMVVCRYDILHSHHDIMSAAYLLASAGLPLKKRIVHVHNTSHDLPTASSVKSALFREPMRQVCLHYADNIVGISRDALDAFLDGKKAKPGRDRIIHCGIDTSQFRRTLMDPAEFRRSFELPENSKILLFVGRMNEYKNPCFVVDVLEVLSRTNLDATAIFAGSGPLEAEVHRLAEQKSLNHRVRVLGWRNDIPLLMQYSDVLVWPVQEQPKEGLGLGVVEAQAAGLPVLMSRSVAEEAIVVPELVEVLPLTAGPQVWADAVISILNRTHLSKQESLARIESSSFSILQSASNIMALYDGLK
jgi:glycosyltransferase involved in cell wall biosynthesis